MSDQPRRIGRPTTPGREGEKATLGILASADLKAKLIAAAEKAGRSMSAEAELRLEQSFRDEGMIVPPAYQHAMIAFLFAFMNHGAGAAYRDLVTRIPGPGSERPDDPESGRRWRETVETAFAMKWAADPSNSDLVPEALATELRERMEEERREVTKMAAMYRSGAPPEELQQQIDKANAAMKARRAPPRKE